MPAVAPRTTPSRNYDSAPLSSHPSSMHVVDNSSYGLGARASRLVATSAKPGIRLVLAIIVMLISMVCSLFLQTWMTVDSFAISSLQQSISRTRQDIQDRQTTLDKLRAMLPEKAEKMGMKPQDEAKVIDLSGYQAVNQSSQSKAQAKPQHQQPEAHNTAQAPANTQSTPSYLQH